MRRFVQLIFFAVAVLLTAAVRPNNDGSTAAAHGPAASAAQAHGTATASAEAHGPAAVTAGPSALAADAHFPATASGTPAQSASAGKPASPAKVATSPSKAAPVPQISQPSKAVEPAALMNKTESIIQPIEDALGTNAKQILPADATEEEIEKDGLQVGSAKEQQEQEEKILATEESATLGAGLDKLKLAENDPRAFLLQLPGMQHFVNGLRVAIELQPKELEGQCLQSGRFKGFGCSKLDSEQPICQCSSMFENCWVDDHSSIVATFNSGKNAEAFERAKSLLFGQCYTPRWLIVVFSGGVAVALLSVSVFLYFFTRQPKSEDASPDLPSLPSFPSLASAIDVIRTRMGAVIEQESRT